MASRIWIDAGHGGADAGAVGGPAYVEKTLTLQVALLTREYLLQHFVCQVGMSRSTDVFLSLTQRTDLANRWGANYFMSIHFNGSGGSGGYESYVYPGVGGVTKRAQEIIDGEVKARVLTKYGIRDRGRKEANFSVVRESNMPAILVETLFVDSTTDQAHIRNAAVLRDFAVAYAEGMAKVLGLTRKAAPAPTPTTPASGPLYRVNAGAYRMRANADAMAARLRAAGFPAYITMD